MRNCLNGENLHASKSDKTDAGARKGTKQRPLSKILRVSPMFILDYSWWEGPKIEVLGKVCCPVSAGSNN